MEESRRAGPSIFFEGHEFVSIDSEKEDEILDEALQSIASYRKEAGLYYWAKRSEQELGSFQPVPSSLFGRSWSKWLTPHTRYSDCSEMTKVLALAERRFGEKALDREVSSLKKALEKLPGLSDEKFRRVAGSIEAKIDRIGRYQRLFNSGTGDKGVQEGIRNLLSFYQGDRRYQKQMSDNGPEALCRSIKNSFQKQREQMKALLRGLEHTVREREERRREILSIGLDEQTLAKIKSASFLRYFKQLRKAPLTCDFLDLLKLEESYQKAVLSFQTFALSALGDEAPLWQKIERARELKAAAALLSPSIKKVRLKAFKRELDLSLARLLEESESSFKERASAARAASRFKVCVERLVGPGQPPLSEEADERLRKTLKSFSRAVEEFRKLRKKRGFYYSESYETAYFQLKAYLSSRSGSSLDELKERLVRGGRETVSGYLESRFSFLQNKGPILEKALASIQAIRMHAPGFLASCELSRKVSGQEHGGYSFFLFKEAREARLKSAYLSFKKHDGIEPLGRGNFSNSVTLSYELTSHKFYAMKSVGPKLHERWKKYKKKHQAAELQGLLLLSPLKGFITLFDCVAYPSKYSSKDRKVAYFLELFKGGTLTTFFQNRDAMTQEEQLEITRDLLKALKDLHRQGVAIRDIKPDNIFMKKPRCGPTLADTGGFIYAHRGPFSPEGSPAYMSPEAFSSEPFDPRLQDIWAMGIVLHELWRGAPRWLSKQGTLYEHIKKITDPNFVPISKPACDFSIDQLLFNMLETDHKKRISAEEAFGLFEVISREKSA